MYSQFTHVFKQAIFVIGVLAPFRSNLYCLKIFGLVFSWPLNFVMAPFDFDKLASALLSKIWKLTRLNSFLFRDKSSMFMPKLISLCYFSAYLDAIIFPVSWWALNINLNNSTVICLVFSVTKPYLHKHFRENNCAESCRVNVSSGQPISWRSLFLRRFKFFLCLKIFYSFITNA